MPKLTIQFGEEMNRLLKELSVKKGTTKSEIIRRSLAMYKYVDDETSDGTKRLSITSAKDDKVLKEIVMLRHG